MGSRAPAVRSLIRLLPVDSGLIDLHTYTRPSSYLYISRLDPSYKPTRTQPLPSDAEILRFFAEPPPQNPRHNNPRTGPGTPKYTAEPDAQILGRFIFKILSATFADPYKPHRGVCLLCTQVVPDIASHLLSFGPHGESWARAIMADDAGGLTFLEWRRLVLFLFAKMAAEGDERITYAQLSAVRWLWTLQDNLLWFEFAEPADEPRYAMPLPTAIYLQRESKGTIPGLDFVLPFAERIREWASKASDRLEQARARMQVQSYGIEGLRL